MDVRRIVGLLVVVFLIYFVIVNPTAAATSVQNIASWLRGAGNSISTFFTRLV